LLFRPSTSAYWQPDNALYVAAVGTTEGAFFPPPRLVIDPDTQTRDRCFGDWPLGNWTPSYTGHISKIGSGGGVSVVADGQVRPVQERRRRVLLHESVPDVTPMGL